MAQNFSDANVKLLEAWIQKKLAGKPCPSCQTIINFSYADHFVGVNQVDPEGKPLQDFQSYPGVMLTCDNCGDMRLLNAKVMGLI